jgi:hypothetical protein
MVKSTSGKRGEGPAPSLSQATVVEGKKLRLEATFDEITATEPDPVPGSKKNNLRT